MSDIILLSFQRPVIIHLVATTADFPFSVTIVGTATLLGDLIDNTTDTWARDLLSLVLFFLSLLLLDLKPSHIEAIVIYIDNGAVGEIDAIV